jgi:hypothetical protein
VRNVVANSLIRDRLPYRKVQERMAEYFQLKVSLGYIHVCFYWAYRQVNTEARRRWAVEHFSGVLCIDEVHDSGWVILYATDPLSHITVHFAINTVNDQEHVDACLEGIAQRFNHGRQRHGCGCFRRRSMIVSKSTDVVDLTMARLARFLANGDITEMMT